jgi:hypothetical protein
MKFEKNKKKLNRELDRLSILLSEVLPRYIQLMKIDEPSLDELKELGEIEHSLIEVNAKITAIKNRLDHDLFGEAIDEYYKLKNRASAGDIIAKKKFDALRERFGEKIKGDTFFNWN